MWQVYVFNFVAALLIAGCFVRAARRLEHRMDERMRKHNEWADAQDAKALAAYAEMETSMRAKVARLIAEIDADANCVSAEMQPSANGLPKDPLADPRTEPIQH